jgi:hypothetical protein
MTAALISACGSGAPATDSSNGSASSNHEQALKFARCMRTHGVSQFPDPSGSGSLTLDGVVNGSSLDTDAPSFTRALTACKDLEPAGFTGRTRTASQQQVALEFAQCMRRNGVPDFPDPTPGQPLIDTDNIPSAHGRGARDIPGFQAAVSKCTGIYAGALGLRGQ